MIATVPASSASAAIETWAGKVDPSVRIASIRTVRERP